VVLPELQRNLDGSSALSVGASIPSGRGPGLVQRRIFVHAVAMDVDGGRPNTSFERTREG
jgi:hypothetical protein